MEIDLKSTKLLSYYGERKITLGDYQMASIEDFKKYTLDLLLEDATRHVNKQKRRVYCDIIIAYPNIFDSLPRILEYYSNRKRGHWEVSLSQCGEEDFYLITFFPRETETEEKPLFFFWKTFRDDKYVTILSFSLHNYREIRRSLDSLVRFVRGLWFAWVGSRFLETFDLFARRVLGEDAQVLASLQTAKEIGKIRKRRVRAFPLPPRKFVPLEDLRKSTRDWYIKEGEIHTSSNMRYRLISERRGIHFTFSMTDRSRITFERGDFTLFVTLLRPLLEETRRMLGILRRNSYTSTSKSTVRGKSMEIKSLDLIQSLVFRKPKETEKWYDKIVSLFGSNIPQEKLVNFTLLSGNPYFLVHIIDVENSSSVYLSATSEELQIVPAESSAKEGTIAKIIGILQAKVDPSISI